MIQKTLRKIFQTKNGKTVIWQKPNLFLWGWIVFTVLKRILGGSAAEWAGYAATASLVVWSILEVARGENSFRRSLGVVVLAVVAYGILD